MRNPVEETLDFSSRDTRKCFYPRLIHLLLPLLSRASAETLSRSERFSGSRIFYRKYRVICDRIKATETNWVALAGKNCIANLKFNEVKFPFGRYANSRFAYKLLLSCPSFFVLQYFIALYVEESTLNSEHLHAGKLCELSRCKAKFPRRGKKFSGQFCSPWFNMFLYSRRHSL